MLIKTGGAFALTAMVPLLTHCGGSGGSGNGATPGSPSTPAPTRRARFLDETQLAALRALVDRLIPGQPEDLDPGAVAACCAEAIDHLLAAFLTDPPFIYAGAPYSDRAGHPVNQFLTFVPLDPYEALAWRIAIEGSQGRPEREFNGPVKGMQQIYIEGLAQLDARAQSMGFGAFADMPSQFRDLILADGSDAAVQDMLDIAFPDTLDAMYGPPEYGGNCDLVGWGFTAFQGDVQPRGWTDEEVINADDPGLFDALLPPSYSAGAASHAASTSAVPALAGGNLTMLPGLLSSESMAAVIMDSGGSLRRLRAHLRPLAQQRVAALSRGVTHA